VSGLLTGAVAMDITRYGSQNAVSKRQVGDIQPFEGGEIRGFRIGVIGTLNFEHRWIYTVFGAVNSFDRGFDQAKNDSFTWFDYRLDIPVFSSQTLSIGKQKEPINMERTMSIFALPFQERTVAADVLFPSRNFGAILSGNALDNRLSWAGGVFNDSLISDGNRSDNTTVYTGRLTYIPLMTKDESNLVHFGVGYRYSDAKLPFRRTQTPETNLAPIFIDSGDPFLASHGETWNYELSYRRGPTWFDSEYTRVSLADSPYGDLEFTGYHIAASWLLTGEMRGYNKKSGSFRMVPIARPVDRGGMGAWELGLRYSRLDANNRGLFAGDIDVYTLALNWWLKSNTSVSLNWKHVALEKPEPEGTVLLFGEVSGLVGRLVLILD
jgi:phosphate-selective porin OprO/OprP